MRIFASAMLAAALLLSSCSGAQPSPSQQQERNEAAERYLWGVIRQFSRHFPELRGENQEGTVLLRLVIDRKGNLVESSVARSSGLPALDKAMLDTVRAAAPYPPMPPVLGERMGFNIPLRSRYRGQ